MCWSCEEQLYVSGLVPGQDNDLPLNRQTITCPSLQILSDANASVLHTGNGFLEVGRIIMYI